MNQALVDWCDEQVETAVRKACGTAKGAVYIDHARNTVLWTDDDAVWYVSEYQLKDDGTATISPQVVGEFQRIDVAPKVTIVAAGVRPYPE